MLLGLDVFVIHDACTVLITNVLTYSIINSFQPVTEATRLHVSQIPVTVSHYEFTTVCTFTV